MSLLSRLAVQASRAYGLLSSGRSTNVSADYLVVAGGGGGGGRFDTTRGAGGGGAGGYLTSTATLSTLNTYTITVGAGGNGGIASDTVNGSNGSDSIISGTGLTTITSTGGGGGGCARTAGSNGGSGGGSGSSVSSPTGGLGVSGQGNNGGNGYSVTTYYNGGGGGGAGAVGSNGTSTTAGAGGNGSASSITGSSVTYAGGGGGGAVTGSGSGGSGGSGGGGTGGSGDNNGGAATTNTGGGGGGASGAFTTSRTGGNGGSGIVIISYTATAPKFVGGTITTSGGKQIHTFTSSGTLTPVTQVSASYLVVAGGGGGIIGFSEGSGGGGAGGMLTGSTTLYYPATYIVTVGAGAASSSAASSAGNSSSNSVLSGTGLTTLTSIGGGGGGSGSYSGFKNGVAGGSGGGGAMGGGSPGTSTGGAGTSGQGNNGGATTAYGSPYLGGGGGGAGAAGSNGGTAGTGNGGAGSASSISGSSVTYAGGGGGGNFNGTGGTGGSGGGGAGCSTSVAPVAGTANLGGGGGGGNGNYAGAAGGSGVVIISYAGSQKFNGGTITTSGGNTIHTFYATGALTPVTNNLTNSLRFRQSASAYLNRTPSVAGDRQKFTYSAWVKRGKLSAVQTLLSVGVTTSSNPRVDWQFNASDSLEIDMNSSGSSWDCLLTTTQVFRDPSAWYHIVVAVDTTQATSANRVKIYVNGSQVTALSSSTYPAQNASMPVNNTLPHALMGYIVAGTQYVDGYLSDVYLIDGQALEPYYFGGNDSNNIWKPVKYYGTYGTNGFRLAFTNTTSTTTIGYDSSPNGNNWTSNNISLTAGTTYDAMTDVPTNTSATQANYCVLSPIASAVADTYSEANLKWTKVNNTTNSSSVGSIAISSGKWYWEGTVATAGGSNLTIGIGDINTSFVSLDSNLGMTGSTTSYAYNGGTGPYKQNNNSQTSYGATYTANDVIGVAFDADAGTLTFYKNNVSQGTAFTGITGTFTPACGGRFTNDSWRMNFGQRPFSYTPPTGFVALNTYNLSTPTIIQGNRYMDATLYTGTGVTNNLVNAAQFQPDLVWVKGRSGATDHAWYDSVRGTTKQLESNTTTAETTESTGLTAFNSNGFTFGALAQMNTSAATYVGWQWQAGQGTTSSGTGTGGITSVTQSVNTTAGFSIVTYTGSGANGTVTHGLGVAPKMVIVKNRSVASAWRVWFTGFAGTEQINLNETTAKETGQPATWNSTVPTSTVFSLGTAAAVNGSTNTLVAYCFAEIAGFSKFGSYTGNGSADGPFVYLGFRPKFVMVKSSSAAENWMIMDSSRDTYNVSYLSLFPNLSNAETSGTGRSPQVVEDFLSNGFKIRGANNEINTSSGTYIYMAFAETPFKYSNSR